MDNRSASNSVSVCGSFTHSNQSRGRDTGHCARGKCMRSLCSFPNSRRRLKHYDLLNRPRRQKEAELAAKKVVIN